MRIYMCYSCQEYEYGIMGTFATTNKAKAEEWCISKTTKQLNEFGREVQCDLAMLEIWENDEEVYSEEYHNGQLIKTYF